MFCAGLNASIRHFVDAPSLSRTGNTGRAKYILKKVKSTAGIRSRSIRYSFGDGCVSEAATAMKLILATQSSAPGARRNKLSAFSAAVFEIKFPFFSGAFNPNAHGIFSNYQTADQHIARADVRFA